MDKKGQLGWIEFKFFMGGFVVGLVLALVLLFLSCSTTVLPKIGFMCGA